MYDEMSRRVTQFTLTASTESYVSRMQCASEFYKRVPDLVADYLFAQRPRFSMDASVIFAPTDRLALQSAVNPAASMYMYRLVKIAAD